jgi:hypothetical protein
MGLTPRQADGSPRAGIESQVISFYPIPEDHTRPYACGGNTLTVITLQPGYLTSSQWSHADQLSGQA